MGKGNRNQNERASNILASGGIAAKKKREYKTWVGTLIVVLVLVLLIAFAAFCILNSRGTFLRMQTVVESENYKINIPMMSYLIYTEYENFVSNYEDTGYMSYIHGTNGTGLSTSGTLRSQVYSVETDSTTGASVTTTWFDYFAAAALSEAKEMLSLCEGARYYGISLTEEEEANIEYNLQIMELYASYYGYTTDYYLAGMYGDGVSLKDVRNMMKITQLASKYVSLKNTEFTDAVTDDRIDTYYTEHSGNYNTLIDYMGVTYTAEFLVVEGQEAADYATFENEKQKNKDRVDALCACTTDDEFKTLLKSYYKADAMANGKNEDEAEEEAEKSLQASIYVNQDQDDITVEEHASWLFSTDARQVGDSIVVNGLNNDDGGRTENGEEPNITYSYTDAKVTYTALRVTRALHADDSMVRDVAHILFKSDSYSDLTSADSLTGNVKTLAQKLVDKGEVINSENLSKELLATMIADGKLTEKDGHYVMSEEDFATYAAIYNEDSNSEYDEVYEGQMVEPFENWLFDDARVEGEVSYPSAVETTYGHHIMLYRGNEQMKWRSEVKSTIVEEEYEAWYKVATAAYTVTISDKSVEMFAKISG